MGQPRTCGRQSYGSFSGENTSYHQCFDSAQTNLCSRGRSVRSCIYTTGNQVAFDAAILSKIENDRTINGFQTTQRIQVQIFTIEVNAFMRQNVTIQI